MNDIGNKLKFLRIQKNMKMKDVAEAAGIAQSSLSYIENGTNSPSVDTLKSILKALNTSLSDFFFEDNILADNRDKESEKLPDHIQKELDIAREFILYKHGIKKTSTDK
jgi:transcriptional regulator with XRE-family HTH domain